MDKTLSVLTVSHEERRKRRKGERAIKHIGSTIWCLRHPTNSKITLETLRLHKRLDENCSS
jgi:hypothetical protein